MLPSHFMFIFASYHNILWLSDCNEFWWIDNSWAKESFVQFWVWFNLKCQNLDENDILATSIGEGDSWFQKPCLLGHKINLTSLELMGMMSLAVTLTWKSARCWRRSAAPQTAHLKGRKTTALIPQSRNNEVCILGQTRASRNLFVIFH